MNSTDKIHHIISLVRQECASRVGLDVDGIAGCGKVFDGLYCWPPAQPGTVAVQSCNNKLIKAVNKTGLATKQCTENGTWYVREDLGTPWTNLTQCGSIYIIDDFDDDSNFYDKWLPIIKNTAYLGYSVSMLSLVISLIIFINIKRLHCERNKLHMHLFISYILRASSFVLKDMLFVEGAALFSDVEYINDEIIPTYTWSCKLFISVRYYLIICNYAFMLMEGLYLHNLIFLNLFSESHGTTIYCFLGWVTPLFFIVPWILLRLFFEDTLCWTQNEQKLIKLLLEIPVRISVMVNFILFTLIVRVLVLKIHFTSTFIQQKKIKYRKLLKSTLILIPLYGIPYTISFILSFYAYDNRILEIFWVFFDQAFASFQGCFAALVYCLFNSEVQSEIKRKYSYIYSHRDQEFRRSRTISSNTQQFSLQNNDDALENLNLFGIMDDDFIKKQQKSSSLDV
ncbi:parathyroid hormone/parathyroid hormone-related peptide receptor-like [Rhynchophorus ferrugineus]|uniref:Parathyroid hormone/parathyroid hormone-related peptide receptor-like protein n=1 Tax=Rhynchophorus ferrugineus TaxID=354439 RepID=A0A5Q0TX28_RHYFE|nr:hypothetical protein GWI33_015019 [Rhynchophorus ferrugineus]QGA72529.1 parathyroid hormone/parathyroid hormone-related peptide receptor-like protein [Rhynchophorus ferrugineus]